MYELRIYIEDNFVIFVEFVIKNLKMDGRVVAITFNTNQ